MKSLPRHLPEAWKKKKTLSGGASPVRIGHHREYTSAYGAVEGGKPLKKLKEAYARLAYEQQTATKYVCCSQANPRRKTKIKPLKETILGLAPKGNRIEYLYR